MKIKRSTFSLLLLLSWLIPAITVAQIQQTKRYERELKNSEEFFTIVSREEKGLILFRQLDKFKGPARIWEYVLLDSDLKEQKAAEFEVKDRYKLIGYEITESTFFILFRTGETTRNDLELIEISIDNGNILYHTIKPEFDFRITHFSYIKNNFAFGGYVNNDPTIFLYELSTNLLKVVPGFFQKDTQLFDMRVNINHTFNVVLVDRGTRGDRKLTFRTFDHLGKMLLEDIVPIEDNKTLQTGFTSQLIREDLVVIGTWGEKNSKLSSGYFFLPINPYEHKKITYYHFGELDEAVNHLKPKRAQRIKEETERLLKEKKSPNFVQNTQPFQLLENSKAFILQSEIYQLTTSQYQNSPYYDPYYGMYPYYGYGYYNRMYRNYYPYDPNRQRSTTLIKSESSSIVAFNEKGEISWDYNLAFKDLEHPVVDQLSDFIVTDSSLTIAYKKESTMFFKKVNFKKDSVNQIDANISSLNPAEVVRSENTHDGGIRRWYNNYFYVYGHQTLRNQEAREKSRKVFYINKVAYP
jgi:hypothetical protein